MSQNYENLIIILDLNSQFWFQPNSEKSKGKNTSNYCKELFSELLSSIGIFINSFLTIHHQNSIDFILTDSEKSSNEYLIRKKIFPLSEGEACLKESMRFLEINELIESRITGFIYEKSIDSSNSLLSSPFAQSICILNKKTKLAEENNKNNFDVFLIFH